MSEKVRILVADDEVVIREMLVDHLTDEGFDIMAVPSGEKALETFQDDQEYLVISDIRMGGMSGIELLEKIREIDSEAIVVMITSFASFDSSVAAMRAGAYDYITKPFQDLDQITSVVRRAMDKVNLIRSNRALIRGIQDNDQKIEESEKKMRKLILKDELTGLFNHQYLMETLEREVSRAERYERVLSLVLLEIDYFDEYVDSCGHEEGEEVLKKMAELLTSRLRLADLITRRGENRFAILMPETGGEQATGVAEDIRSLIEETFREGEHGSFLEGKMISFSVTQYPADAEHWKNLLRKGDEALAQARLKKTMVGLLQ